MATLPTRLEDILHWGDLPRIVEHHEIYLFEVPNDCALADFIELCRDLDFNVSENGEPEDHRFWLYVKFLHLGGKTWVPVSVCGTLTEKEVRETGWKREFTILHTQGNFEQAGHQLRGRVFTCAQVLENFSQNVVRKLWDYKQLLDSETALILTGHYPYSGIFPTRAENVQYMKISMENELVRLFSNEWACDALKVESHQYYHKQFPEDQLCKGLYNALKKKSTQINHLHRQ